MTLEETIFLYVLILNTLIAFVYLIYHLIAKKETDNRKQFIMHTVIMIICPVVGIIYFSVAFLKYRFIKLGDRDLSDVEFSKKRHIARVKADENRERNIVSVGEAILVSDQEKERTNMLNVLLGETDESYSAIALALDSDDSEVAHYAASFLQSKMDTFRANVRKMQQRIDEGDIEDEECQKRILKLIEYMNHILKQNVFTQVEQTDYVEQMEQLCEKLYKNAKYKLMPECYEYILSRIMELNNYDRAQLWGERFYEQYPNVLSAYTLRLKLYFETNHKDKTFEVLEQIKESSVIIDNRTLELIRMIEKQET